MKNIPWSFYLADGSLIGTFPSSFHVNAWAFALVMHAHAYAWQMPYKRN